MSRSPKIGRNARREEAEEAVLKVDCVEGLLNVEGFQEFASIDACGWLGSLHVDWRSQRREERKGSGKSQKGERPGPRWQKEGRRRPQERGKEDEGGREERRGPEGGVSEEGRSEETED